jgi:hypothetical protein
MANTSYSQPNEPGPGEPNKDQHKDQRSADIVLVEIAKLQADGEHLKSDMKELRADMRDVRDRMIRLEEAIRGDFSTRLSHINDRLQETKKKGDRVHTWVIGAAAIMGFVVVVVQIALRVWH